MTAYTSLDEKVIKFESLNSKNYLFQCFETYTKDDREIEQDLLSVEMSNSDSNIEVKNIQIHSFKIFFFITIFIIYTIVRSVIGGRKHEKLCK